MKLRKSLIAMFGFGWSTSCLRQTTNSNPTTSLSKVISDKKESKPIVLISIINEIERFNFSVITVPYRVRDNFPPLDIGYRNKKQRYKYPKKIKHTHTPHHPQSKNRQG